MSRVPRAATAVLTATMATILLGPGAFAYWTGTGSGTTPGSTGTSPLVNITPGVPTAALYPDGHSDVTATVTNANAFEVHVGSLLLDTGQGTGGFAVDASHTACDLSVLGFTTQTTTWTVPGKVGSTDGELPVTLTDALSMTAGAANSCQGASFTVYLTAGP